MSQAPLYTPSTDFAEEERNNVGGRSTVRTAQLDAEHSAISASINALRSNQSLNQRDDGEIRDGRVKLHTLSADVLALVTAQGGTLRGDWLTATGYALKDVVVQSTNTYICAIPHTSGTFATDLAADKWILLTLGSAVAASSIPFTPSATLAATNVQAALEEADTENRALSAAASAAAALAVSNPADTSDSALGDALIGVKRTGTGTVATTLHDWVERQTLSIAEKMTFAQIADALAGTLGFDLAPIIVTAATALGAAGGTVRIPEGFHCLVDTTPVIPANVSIVGPHQYVGSPATNLSAPYAAVGGSLIVNSAATITLSGSASLTGLLIYRKGMTFPSADSSLFAGTAITIGGDDTGVSRCAILGFNKAYYTSGYQRPRLVDLNVDCVNGVEITSCADVPYLDRVHCWPFATIAALGAHGTIERSGKAFYLHDTVDWGKLTNCFAYGYAVGYHIENANSTTLLNCGADSTFSGAPLHAGSIGAEVTLSSSGTRFINFQVSAQGATGLYINTSANLHTEVTGLNAWYNGSHNVLIDAGDAKIDGGETRNAPYGVSVNNTASKVHIDGVRFYDIGTIPIYLTAAGSNVKIGKNDYGNWAAGSPVAGSNHQLPTIASASTLNVPPTGDAFNVSGAVAINDIAGMWAGRRVALYFVSNPSVTHSAAGTTTKVFLRGAVTRAMTAGGCLAIFHNGNTNTEEGA